MATLNGRPGHLMVTSVYPTGEDIGFPDGLMLRIDSKWDLAFWLEFKLSVEDIDELYHYIHGSRLDVPELGQQVDGV